MIQSRQIHNSPLKRNSWQLKSEALKAGSNFTSVTSRLSDRHVFQLRALSTVTMEEIEVIKGPHLSHRDTIVIASLVQTGSCHVAACAAELTM